MPERTGYDEGVFNWVDLSCGDVAQAKAFYGALLGWSFQDEEDGGEVYTLARKGSKNVAGLRTQGTEEADMGAPFHWLTYISVNDCDATTAKAEAAGGTVLVPALDVGEDGRMSVVRDPTGGWVSLWQPKHFFGAERVNEPGTWCWNELITADVGGALAFYGQVFGWTPHPIEMGAIGTYTVIKQGDHDIGGMMHPPMEGIPTHWGVYFAVDDCDAMAARCQELGGRIMAEPLDAPAGRLAHLADDQGVAFAVIALAEPSS